MSQPISSHIFRVIFSVVTLFLTVQLAAQVNEEVVVHYHYDAAGNRVQRTIEIIGQAPPEEADEDLLKNNERMLSTMSVFPNPTNDEVNVQLTELSEEKMVLMLSTQDGLEIERTVVTDLTVGFNMRQHAAGPYLLTLMIGGERAATWRIIKN